MIKNFKLILSKKNIFDIILMAIRAKDKEISLEDSEESDLSGLDENLIDNKSSNSTTESSISPNIEIVDKRKYYNIPDGYDARIELVKDINWSKTLAVRAGIIIYSTNKDGKNYFVMGVDDESRELSDFGGGVKYKGDINALTAACREFKEETLEIFGELRPEHLENYPCILSSGEAKNEIILIMVRLKIDDFDVVRDNFRERVIDKRIAHEKIEICDLIALSPQDFDETIRGVSKRNKMFTVVKLILSAGIVNDLIDYL